MEEDYYEIMGLPRTATKADIKKAYRQLALRYHPDKHPEDRETAEQKFIQITKAYNTLMDDEDRRKYDLYGNSPGHHRSTPYSRTALDDLYEHFYDKGNEPSYCHGDDSYDHEKYCSPSQAYCANARNAHHQHSGSVPPHIPRPDIKRKSTDSTDDEDEYLSSLIGTINVRVFVTLEEIYTGCQKVYKVARCRDGVIEHKSCIVTVTPGFPTGGEIRAPGSGNKMIGRPADDIVFTVLEKPHDRFRRDKDDIHEILTITLKDALLGFTLHITDISGEQVTQNVQGPINADEPVVIYGHGMPNSETNLRGNHFVHFNIVYPTTLTEAQRKAIIDLF